MRSLFIKSVLLSLLCMSVFACSKDISVLKEDGTTSYSVNAVNIQDAIKIARSFANTSNELISTRSSEIVVDNAFSIKGNSVNPLLHVINFKNGGFTIIAGDNRLMPIQAYSSSGAFSRNDNDYPLGLKIWIESIQDSLSRIKDVEPDLYTIAAWQKFNNGKRYSQLTRSLTPEGGVLPEADTVVGPLITDSWHQDSPYNDSLANTAHYYQSGGYAGTLRPLVGCVPLAIARIMRYHEYPDSFSWSSMPNSIPQSTSTKLLMRDIHQHLVSFYYPNTALSYLVYENIYGGYSHGTGVPSALQIGSFLQSEYGYASGEDRSYSTSAYTAMRRDLIDHELPCIIRGQSSSSGTSIGHAWICDGYHYHCEHWLDANLDPFAVVTTYLHYCWGKTTTTQDGWYSSNNVSLDNVEYKYNMKLIYHISPIDYWHYL